MNKPNTPAHPRATELDRSCVPCDPSEDYAALGATLALRTAEYEAAHADRLQFATELTEAQAQVATERTLRQDAEAQVRTLTMEVEALAAQVGDAERESEKLTVELAAIRDLFPIPRGGDLETYWAAAMADPMSIFKYVRKCVRAAPSARVLSEADRHTLRRVIDCAEVLDKRPRPMCRDCADEDGTCPHGGLECDMRKLFADARAIIAATSTASEGAPSAADYEEVLASHRRLVRELDVLLNGEAGAAKQASLCDIVSQVRAEGIKVDDGVVRNAARYRWLTETMGLRLSPKGATAIRDMEAMNAHIDAAITAASTAKGDGDD